jgi:hypothetical protein
MLLAQAGVPSGTWWDAARDPAVWIATLLGVGVFANGVYGIVAAGREARSQITDDLYVLARRAFVPINGHLRDVPINQLRVHIWTTEEDRLSLNPPRG